MKARKILLVLLAVGALLAAAAGLSPYLSAPEPSPTPEPTPAPAPTSVPTPTPTPEPTTEPIPYLDTETGDIRGSFTAENGWATMEYYLYVPEKAVENMPLVVFLHGDGLVGQPDELKNCGIVTQAKEIYGDDVPFILLAPCTVVPSWTDNAIPATLRELIDYIAAEYLCDTEHIILTGHSRGATGVWTMVSRNPAYFSAAVPVSCSAVELTETSFLETPTWAIVGDGWNDDGLYGQSMRNHVNCLKLVGAEAQFSTIENCSHAESGTKAYTRELFEWMLAQ